MIETTANRRGWLFPGQASQHVGMGADLLDVDLFSTLTDRASERSGLELRRLMTEGPADALADTVATQLSVFLVSVTVADHLRRSGVVPAAVSGHSVGEFAALVAGGWLDPEPAVDAVTQRAKEMRACCEATRGTMVAVIGLAPDVLDALRAEVAGSAVVANRNSPKQSVVAGTPEDVDAFTAAAVARGAMGVIPLDVSGAFHSPLMAAAEAAFAPVVEALPLRMGDVPLVSSITGREIEDLDEYRTHLAGQITAPVRWDEAVATLRGLCPDGFLEVGPGRALRGLVRQIGRDISVTSCDGLAACADVTAATASTPAARAG